MPIRVINGVNAPTNTSAFTSGNPVYVLDTVPTARTAANGLRPIRMSGVHLDVGGGVTLYFGVWNDNGTDGAGSAAIGTAAGVGRYSATVSKYLPDANLQDIRVGWFGATGSVNFGRAGVAGRTIVDGFGNYPNASLTGLWTYEQVPSEPTMAAAIVGPAGSVVVSFNGSADNGDAPITGWRLQRADNPSFTNAVTVDSSGSTAFTGLVPGRTYWFRAAGRNNVSDAYGTTGPWSSAIAATMRAGGKVKVAGVMKSALPKVKVAGVMKDALIKVRSGGTWKDAL
ncbi:fibronectin type III domain-containing protein [Plantibacter flavus]|uniref:fibronectin type III domain-containing protein n=1 Tax=Plantibacter flavus TaxID=150123 RepID=UPI003F15ED28